MPEPKTVAEQLDAAQTREEFLAVLNGLFATAQRMKDEASE